MDLFDTGDDPFDAPPTDNPFTTSNSATKPNIQAIHAPKLCGCLEPICEHSNVFEQHGTNRVYTNALARQQIVSNQVISFNGVGNQLFGGYFPPQSSTMGYQQSPGWIDADALASHQIVSNRVISVNGVGSRSFSWSVPPQTSMIGYQPEFNTAEVVTPF
jgi:hypothetical protein